MRETALHGFECRLDDRWRGVEIRVTDLQADELASAGLEGIDTVGEGNGGRLANEFKLVVEVHGDSYKVPRSGEIKFPHYNPVKQTAPAERGLSVFFLPKRFFGFGDHFVVIGLLPEVRHVFDVGQFAITPDNEDRAAQETAFLDDQTVFEAKVSI